MQYFSVKGHAIGFGPFASWVPGWVFNKFKFRLRVRFVSGSVPNPGTTIDFIDISDKKFQGKKRNTGHLLENHCINISFHLRDTFKL